MLQIYDGNNVFRRRLESDQSGQPLRYLLAEIRGHYTRNDTPIVVWDPPNARRRRRDLVPYYKAKRLSTPDDVRKSMQFFKELCGHAGLIQVEVPGYEADDVIATLVRQSAEPCVIHSNDGDFLQLGVDVRCDIELKRTVEPERVRLYKAVVGDSSDNLKGIYLCGKGTWPRLDLDLLQQTITTGPVPDQETLLAAGLSPASASWLRTEPNIDLIRAEYEVAGFFTVPPVDLDRGTTIAPVNEAIISQLLERFMQ